jgi:hypothetical protein
MTAPEQEGRLLRTALGRRSSLLRPRNVLDQKAIRGVRPPGARSRQIGAAVTLP